MNSQSTKMANHQGLNSRYQEVRKTERSIVLFCTIVTMLLLFSCKKKHE